MAKMHSKLCGRTTVSSKIVGALSQCAITEDALQACCGTLKFLAPKEYVHIEGDKLPHWNQDGCVQFVTFRLADSLPQTKLQEYRRSREEWIVAHPKPWDRTMQLEYENLFCKVVDKWLDSGYGHCMLKDERARKLVENAILFFNGDRYVIHAYVIMPNHVHVLLSPFKGNDIRSIVSSWKKFSAREINKLYNIQGPVWERECFDHMIRNGEAYRATLEYIADNPKGVPDGTYTLSQIGH